MQATSDDFVEVRASSAAEPIWMSEWPEPAGGTPTRKKAHRVKRAARVLLICLAWGIFGVLATFAWPSSLGGAATWVVVSGHSMEPTFYTGDLVLIWKTNRWEMGDAVAYRVGGGTQGSYNIIHRLVEGDKTGGWLARGDNKPMPDPWRIQDKAIEGEEVFHIPRLGNLIALIRVPKVMSIAAGILVGMAILFGPEINNTGKKRKKKDK